MSILVKCACGEVHEMPDAWAGKRGKCPKCGRLLRVPRPQKEAPAPSCDDAPAESAPKVEKTAPEPPPEEEFVPFSMRDEDESYEDGTAQESKQAEQTPGVEVKGNTISFECTCGKVLKTTVDKAGRTAKCPQCKSPLTVPSPPEEKEELKAVFDLVEEDDQEILECPNCGAELTKKAVICVKCGTNRISGETIKMKTGDEAFSDEPSGLKKALGKAAFWKKKD